MNYRWTTGTINRFNLANSILQLPLQFPMLAVSSKIVYSGIDGTQRSDRKFGKYQERGLGDFLLKFGVFSPIIQ